MIFSSCNLQSCNVMSRQPHVRAPRASPAQKSQGWRVDYYKNFSRATFFVFWGTHLVNRYLSYLLVKQIWRKSAVWNCYARFQNGFDLTVERSWQDNLFTSAASYVVIFHHFKVYMAVKLDFLPVIKWTCATIVTGTINKSSVGAAAPLFRAVGRSENRGQFVVKGFLKEKVLLIFLPSLFLLCNIVAKTRVVYLSSFSS